MGIKNKKIKIMSINLVNFFFTYYLKIEKKLCLVVEKYINNTKNNTFYLLILLVRFSSVYKTYALFISSIAVAQIVVPYIYSQPFSILCGFSCVPSLHFWTFSTLKKFIYIPASELSSCALFLEIDQFRSVGSLFS